MLTAQDIRGVYAIIPTPAKEGADRWDATDTVDLDETARLVERLIGDGVSGLITLGTTGECATLSQADYRTFVDCFLATVHKRVPTFVGTTALGTHDIVARIRFVREQGADGTILGLPMWQPCTTEMAAQFYTTISEAFPDFAVMAYANARAFRYRFPPAFWKLVAERAPTVTSVKVTGLANLRALLRAGGRRINFLPVVGEAYTFARVSPDTMTAFWDTSAPMGPQPSVALMDAIQARDWARAEQVADDIAWASETFMPPGGEEEFAAYNIQLEKIRFDAAGYCKAGPIRPPYNVIPEHLAEGARECARRWRTLCEKYARVKS